MFLNAYTLLDMKTGMHLPPFFQHHDEMAKRMLYEACCDERSSLAKYPSDYVLLKIGQFDDSVGQLINMNPVNLGSVAAIYARTTTTNLKATELTQPDLKIVGEI